ncbi:MAG TPA: hemerythrin family protein [Geobacteraceae bacterium]|nr:hemerythrin family protein [Geobacteraceae bacterium]
MQVAWDESLSVGVVEIDDQHKQIFDNFNAFSIACREGHGAEKLNDLFWFLSSYVATHFANEERLMQRVGFPDYPSHYELHTTFISKVDELMGRFSTEGPSQDLVATVNEAIKDWLLEHISVMDRTIGQFVKEQGKG